MTAQRRKIPLWKLVGGGAVHTVVPAYLLALGVDGWTHRGAGLDGWLTHVPHMSLWFMGAYTGAGLAATLLAALADRWAAQPPHPDDQAETQAAQHLRQALARGRGAFGPEGDGVLDRIGLLRPDPASAEVRALLRDLAAMVEAGRAAVEASPESDTLAHTVTALTRIAAALERQARDRAALAQDKALVMATYVEQRYGQDEIQDHLK